MVSSSLIFAVGFAKVSRASRTTRWRRPWVCHPDLEEPHVTLARIKSDWGKVGKALTAGGYLDSREVVSALVVDEVVLYRSELSSAGPRYEVLWSLPFTCSSKSG